MSPRMRSRSGFCGTDTPVCASRRTDKSVCPTTRLAARIVTKGMLGSLLLRLFLRRSLAAGELIADFHFDDEPLVVIGSDFIDDVVLRKLQTVSLGQLL